MNSCNPSMISAFRCDSPYTRAQRSADFDSTSEKSTSYLPSDYLKLVISAPTSAMTCAVVVGGQQIVDSMSSTFRLV